MTLAPRRQPLSFSDLDDVAAAIRDNGGRLTSARRVVLAALFAADGPVSAEYIAAGLGGQLIESEVSSVYRNLERLEELGVVRHLHVGHGPGLYALEDDTNREYLVCERCARVDSVEAGGLDRAREVILKAFGYQIRFSHFPLVGLCPRCVEDEPPAGSQRTVPGARQGTGDEHQHGEIVHGHPHIGRTHDHVEHTHEHSHGDRVHPHDHVHQQHLEADHEHRH